jgi:hypothetical protein
MARPGAKRPCATGREGAAGPADVGVRIGAPTGTGAATSAPGPTSARPTRLALVETPADRWPMVLRIETGSIPGVGRFGREQL